MEFVQARDPSNHSMLHQTLLPCPPFSFQPSPLHLARSHPFPSSRSSSQAVKEADMEAAFKKSEKWPTPQNQQSIVSAVDVAWATDPSNHVGEEFSVDDLLDFGGFMETDENSGGGGEEDEGDDSLEEDRCLEAGNPNSHSSSSSSALSFEPPPPTEIALHADDVAQLEWLSRVVDDSYSEFPPSPGVPPPSKSSTPIETKAENRQSHAFGTVALSLERTPCALSIESLVPVKSKRSKRKRSAGATWSARGSSCSSSCITTSPSPSSCSSSSSSPTYLVYDYYAGVSNPNLFLVEGNPAPPKKLKQKKKRGRKPKQPQLIEAAGGNYAVGSSGGERRCSHCGVQKTPQWRAGPMGPKTLCNACGVRYKSGRLLPEYRPACSPTFISHVHPNSHRKVLEMRRKKEEQEKQLFAFTSAAAVATTMV